MLGRVEPQLLFGQSERPLRMLAGQLELSTVDGDLWTFGPEEAANRVTGPALDFCLLVTQRRHRSATGLVAEGPIADAWLDLAQAFAGAPGPGRPPAAPEAAR